MIDSHTFSVEDAVKHGIEKAVLLYNIRYWIAKNMANGKHLYDGFYWTYNSQAAFAELFPYMSSQKIGRILREMESDGLIASGNYNKAGYDRTKWYTVPSMFIVQIQTMENSNLNNALFGSEQPIPDNYQITTKEDITSDSDESTRNRDSWNFEECKDIWNRAVDQSECPATKCKIVPDSFKKGIAKVHKAYIAFCRTEKRTVKPKEEWLLAYAVGHLRRCEGFVGRSEAHQNWKPSIADLAKMKTFENLINQ